MAPAEADKPLCFAIMPITTPDDAVARYGGDSDHFVHVAEFIFKPAAELAGYRFVPAAVDSSRVIQAAIIKNLADAHVVLCDTSLWNANVFFELGIRVALNKPVALVRDKLTTSTPFDNTPVHCYEYDHRMEPRCLRLEIPKLSEHIRAAAGDGQNELWKFAGIAVTAQQSDASNPEDAKLDLIMAKLETLQVRVNAVDKNTAEVSRSRRGEAVAKAEGLPPSLKSETSVQDLAAYIDNINNRYSTAIRVSDFSDTFVTLSSETLLARSHVLLIKGAIRKTCPEVTSFLYTDPNGSKAISMDPESAA